MRDRYQLPTRSGEATRRVTKDDLPAQRSAQRAEDSRGPNAGPRPLRIGEFRRDALGVYQVVAITPTDVKVRYTDGRNVHLSFKLAQLSYKLADQSAPAPQRAGAVTNPPPFRIGSIGADERGVYEVLAVFWPRMRIRYRSGEGATVDIDAQFEACRRLTSRSAIPRRRAAQGAPWFRVGESYHDHRGVYAVLSVDYPAMMVQYESGHRAHVDMSAKWRVHEAVTQDLAKRVAQREGHRAERARAPYVHVYVGGLPEQGRR